MATQAQGNGSVKDIQAHLRDAKTDTTANEYMKALPESVQEMAGSAYRMFAKGGEENACWGFATKHHKRSSVSACQLLILWWALQDSNLRLPPCEGGTLPLS